MALREWELEQQLAAVLPLGESELNQILSYVGTLSGPEATEYLKDLLGNSSESLRFITAFEESRLPVNEVGTRVTMDSKDNGLAPVRDSSLSKGQSESKPKVSSGDAEPTTTSHAQSKEHQTSGEVTSSPRYAPPAGPPPRSSKAVRHHTNQVIEAARVRAQDEVHL